MRIPRVLCIVLAGGRGSRLGPLTAGRAKPSLPVAGHYRLIDVALSNAAHSALVDVWVLEQYEPHLLNEHLAGGRPWDLDRTRGGFRVLPPYEGFRDDFDGGNADALVTNWPVIEAISPDVLIVCSADHLITIDFRDVVATLLDSSDEVTIVTTALPRGSDASRYLVVQRDGDRVTAVDYKPDRPRGRTVGTEIFAYRPDRLRDRLTDLTSTGKDLGDYGERLIPAMVADGAAGSFNHDGHWRDLGTPESYLDGQLELLRDRPPLVFDDPAWPILTSMPVRRPAFVRRTAELDRAWLSPGCDVGGTVVNSIIGPDAVVERGAEVRHSVIMGDARIRAGARVSRAVVAETAVIGRNAVLGAPQARRPVLVGSGRRVPAGAELAAGATLEPANARDLFATTR